MRTLLVSTAGGLHSRIQAVQRCVVLSALAWSLQLVAHERVEVLCIILVRLNLLAVLNGLGDQFLDELFVVGLQKLGDLLLVFNNSQPHALEHIVFSEEANLSVFTVLGTELSKNREIIAVFTELDEETRFAHKFFRAAVLSISVDSKLLLAVHLILIRLSHTKGFGAFSEYGLFQHPMVTNHVPGQILRVRLRFLTDDLVGITITLLDVEAYEGQINSVILLVRCIDFIVRGTLHEAEGLQMVSHY